MTLPDDDGHIEEASDALEPGVNGVETPLQPPENESKWQAWYAKLEPLFGYLPTGVHESDTERDGLLSYSVEVHAAIIGLAVGLAAGTTGNAQLALALVSVALGVGRVQQQFSEKVRSQLIKEPWYALSGTAVGYAALYLAQSGALLS